MHSRDVESFPSVPDVEACLRQIADLRAELEEARETLDAIRNGEVDAVVVGGPNERRVYTLETADRPYRVLVEQIREGAVILGSGGEILFANPALAQLLGAASERLAGRAFASFVEPRDRSRFAALISRGGRVEMSLRCDDGESRPVLVSLDEFSAESGRIMCGVITDLTEPRAHALELSEARSTLAAESAKRERDERYRLILEGATDYAIIVVDPDERVSVWSGGAAAMLGWDAEEVVGATMPAIWTAGDAAAGVPDEEADQALAHGRAESERWYVRKDGSRFWATSLAMALRSQEGAVIGLLRIMRDESDRRRAEENRQVLVNELNHRVKNTLATVQSITALTLRNVSTLEQGAEAIAERLVALARAHDVLTRENWEGAPLTEVIETATGAYRRLRAERIHLVGAEVRVPPRVALALSMALQELATNAAKYGALSREGGTVAIHWAECGGGVLELIWEERGGPPVVKPARRGFGTRLIERSLGAELGEQVGLEFRPAGVRCCIRCRLI